MRRKAVRRSRIAIESLESRSLLTATVLASEPMLFDPTPAQPQSGDELAVGTIQILRDGSTLSLGLQINSPYDATYHIEDASVDLSVNGGTTQTIPLSLPEHAKSATLTVPQTVAVGIQFSISASVGVTKVDTSVLNFNLPALAAQQILPSGQQIVAPNSLFDANFSSANILPALGGTSLVNDTVTFPEDPGWRTGEAVRVVATIGAPETGIGTHQVSYTQGSSTFFGPGQDRAAAVVRYVRRETATAYSFYLTSADAVSGQSRVDLTAAVPADGTMLFSGSSSDLPFFGQTAVESSAIPSATDDNADTVQFASAPIWLTGDAVEVSASTGGLAAGIWYVRVQGSNYSFYSTAGEAADLGSSAGLVDLTGPVTANLSLANRVQFPAAHRWTTGTAVRLVANSSAEIASVNSVLGEIAYVRVVDGTSVTLHSSAAEAASGSNPWVLGGSLTTSISPIYNAFCIDYDRATAYNRTYTTQIFSSYDVGSLPDTTFVEKNVNDKLDRGRAVGAPVFLTASTAGSTALTSRNAADSNNLAHGLATGDVVRVPLADSGYSTGTDYYVRSLSSTTLSLHLTAADASTGTNAVPAPSTSLFPVFGSTALIKFTSASTGSILTSVRHLLPTGTAVRLDVAAGGLSTGVDYFVRSTGANTITLHTTAADAGTGNAPITFSAVSTLPVFPSQSVRFASGGGLSPAAGLISGRSGIAWPTGTRVQVDLSSAGLTTGTDYFIRHLGNQQFSLHLSRDAALAGTNPISFTAPIVGWTKFFVPEQVVENTSNLDVVNWLLNSSVLNQLAGATSPDAVSSADQTIAIVAHKMKTGDRFQVT
ncbi:MAG: hypothetical protein ACK50P_16980, partial [Planctomycetaceae bacterium]